jgi:hypothetical protein
MSLNALSGHGTLIARNGTTIAELGDITLPELSRNEFEALTQSENIDSYILGVLRRGPVTVKMNFIPTNATHDHLTGLANAIITNSMDGYTFTVPTTPPWIWIASGQVQKMTDVAPVDGKLESDVTIRLSGKFYINGVLIG